MTQEEKTRAFEKCRRMDNIASIFCDASLKNPEDVFLDSQATASLFMYNGMRDMLKTFGLFEEYVKYKWDRNSEQFGCIVASTENFPDYRYSLTEVINELERI